MWYYSSHRRFSARAVTVPNNTEVAALRAWLEAIVKEAEDAEEQATAAHRHV
jgi:hypothetical protein